jgi:phage terminase large subunit-like protein
VSDPAVAAVSTRLAPAPERAWHQTGRPEQLAPEGAWSVWLYMGGRGTGKSRSGAEWTLEGALTYPKTEWAVIAPTFGSARDICCEGPGGLLRIAQRGEVVHYVRSLGELRLRNGSKIFVRSGDEPERVRGMNLAGAWLDELALFRYGEQLWHESLMPAVRVDPARIMVSTTPRPTALLKSILGRQDGSVVVTRGSTWDNQANLSSTALEELRLRYAGTRLGRSELLGEMLEDVEGALWDFAMFDDHRVEEAPELDRVVVAVDPSVSTTGSGDETGIVVCGVSGRGQDAQFFVLADESLRATPHRWASRVAVVYGKWGADRVVAETNQGGGMVTDTLRNVAPNLAVRTVHAFRSKQLRAEPVVALFEQGRVHVVGFLAQLEEQCTTWLPGVGRSPDRVDALVYALSDLAESRPRRKRRMTMLARNERAVGSLPMSLVTDGDSL